MPRPSTPDEDELKIFASVPDQYVARLIGKNGENVKAIMSKAKCKISFQKAPIDELRSSEGEKVRMCFVSGNSYSISRGVKLLLEQISKLESI
jgi:transcription antitermination factor NusA-like protein